MSLTQLRNCNFGTSYGSLATVGYTVFDSNGVIVTPRTIAGVYELVAGSGLYAAQVSFADDFRGSIVWDTGGATPAYATEQYNVEENNSHVDDIYHIEHGRWRIDSATRQMIFYREDNITEVARFDLYDANGNPTVDSPFERRRA